MYACCMFLLRRCRSSPFLHPSLLLLCAKLAEHGYSFIAQLQYYANRLTTAHRDAQQAQQALFALLAQAGLLSTVVQAAQGELAQYPTLVAAYPAPAQASAPLLPNPPPPPPPPHYPTTPPEPAYQGYQAQPRQPQPRTQPHPKKRVIRAGEHGSYSGPPPKKRYLKEEVRALEALGERTVDAPDYPFHALTPEQQQKYLAYFHLQYLGRDHPVNPNLLREVLQQPRPKTERSTTPIPPSEGTSESAVRSIFANEQ